ncbi:protein FAM228A isoform X2 [Xiphophorus couchianus]|uniref:protein FAM228A isoform X2 n=1 Tax=Xiphophorus couchianus TaxID=32473 RepID=UPI001016A625|nr:protein FAM228A-like isoform X2 [Xiphophorus couchianus]
MAAVKETTERRWSIAQPSVRAKSSLVCVKPGTWNLVPSLCGPRYSFEQDQLCHPSFRQLQEKESFLTQRKIEELRKKELIHKRWTENVWFPIQMRVENHTASCYFMDSMRHQIMHSHYLLHCQSKIRTSGSREIRQLNLQLKKKLKRPSSACQAGSKPASNKTLERPETGSSLTNSLMSQD